MIVKYDKEFQKQFKKSDKKIQIKFAERLELFMRDSANSMLRMHPLKGKFTGYWSINVTGDVRALFYYEGNTVVIFALIGTHSQLYG